MANPLPRNLRLLQRLTALRPAWHRPPGRAALPPHVRRFVHQADPAVLEQLLIETVRRLDTGEPPRPAEADRAALHKALQAEVRAMRRASTAPRREPGWS